MELNKYRSKLEEIDEKIMELVKERLSLSVKIGTYKKKNKLPIEVLSREEELTKKYETLYNDSETWKYYKEIFKVILKTSKDIQDE